MKYVKKWFSWLIVFIVGFLFSAGVSPRIFYPDLADAKIENNRMLGQLEDAWYEIDQANSRLGLEKKLNEIAWEKNINLQIKIGILEKEIAALMELFIILKERIDDFNLEIPPDREELNIEILPKERGC